MKVLIVTNSKFWVENRGNRARTACLCRSLLSRKYQASVLYLGDLDRKDRKILASDYPTLVFYPYQPQRNLFQGVKTQVSRTLRRIKRNVTHFVQKILKFRGSQPPHSPRELKLIDYRSESARAYFQAVCRALQPDIVMVEYITYAYLVEGCRQDLPGHVRLMIDTHDVMHQRNQKFHEMGERHWLDITEEEERTCLDLFDTVIAIKEKDAAVFKKMLPGKSVIIAGHAPQINRHTDRNSAWINLTYIGSDGPHNRQAISYFIKTIWPTIRLEHGSKVRLNIFGSVCESLKHQELRPGIHLFGYVKDLNRIYRDTDIVVNPVFFGGGLSIKNVEALCHGKPLVTTSLGAEGLGEGSGQAFFICDSAESTIRQINALINDPLMRHTCSEKALEHAQTVFTDSRAYGELFRVLEETPPKE